MEVDLDCGLLGALELLRRASLIVDDRIGTWRQFEMNVDNCVRDLWQHAVVPRINLKGLI